MTAIDVLRRMLDERGVEWFETAPLKTEWNGTGVLSDIGFQAIGELPPAPQYLLLDADHLFTPEQAIAATLASCNCSNDCANGERMDVPCLPHFWTHDGTLHIEATRMPARIVVCEGGTCEFVPKRELDASEAENAKLRELVPILAYCMSEDRDCDRCALNGADMPTPRISACDSLHDLMRELEVTA